MASTAWDSESDSSASYDSNFNVERTDINTAEFHLDCEDCIRDNYQVQNNYIVEDARETFSLFRLARVYVTGYLPKSRGIVE